MIRLHRLGHMDDAPFHLNPDLILTVEAHPDTVVTLTTGIKVIVAETPEAVVDAVRALARLDPRGRRCRCSTRRRTGALTIVRGGGSLATAPGPDDGASR